MKSKIALFILLCANSIYAQYPVLSTTSLANDPRLDSNYTKKGNYARDITNQRDQYVGLWKYEENGILLELKIEKRDKVINRIATSYNFTDVVIIKYKLIKNGLVLYDNLNINPPEGYLSSGYKYGVDDYLSGLFVDKTHNVRSSFSIKLINSNPEKIFFNLSSGSYHFLNPSSYYENLNEIFTVPLDGIEMTLIN